MSNEALVSSPFISVPKEILKLIVIESGNPNVLQVCKFFNAIHLENSFWIKIIEEITGENACDFTADLRFALQPPTSWGCYKRYLLEYKTRKESFSSAFDKFSRSGSGVLKRLHVSKITPHLTL